MEKIKRNRLSESNRDGGNGHERDRGKEAIESVYFSQRMKKENFYFSTNVTNSITGLT